MGRCIESTWLDPTLIFLLKYTCPWNIMFQRTDEICLATAKPFSEAKSKKSRTENRLRSLAKNLNRVGNLRLWWEPGWSFSSKLPFPFVFPLSLLDHRLHQRWRMMSWDYISFGYSWRVWCCQLISTANKNQRKSLGIGREFICPLHGQNTVEKVKQRTWEDPLWRGPIGSIGNISLSTLSLSGPTHTVVHLGSRKKQRDFYFLF